MSKPPLYPEGGKRLFDVITSAVAIVLLMPLMVIIAVTIAVSSPGGFLFRQTRVGRNRRVFTILKFRTMIAGADRLGPGITREDDPRITPIGRFLRRYKLDELPQFINVLRGDMSLVGPRPELPLYVEEFSEKFETILNVRPGITDPASIAYRDEENLLELAEDSEIAYRNVVLLSKLSLNLDYVRQMSFSYDLKLLLRTAAVLPRRSGA